MYFIEDVLMKSGLYISKGFYNWSPMGMLGDHNQCITIEFFSKIFLLLRCFELNKYSLREQNRLFKNSTLNSFSLYDLII